MTRLRKINREEMGKRVADTALCWSPLATLLGSEDALKNFYLRPTTDKITAFREKHCGHILYLDQSGNAYELDGLRREWIRISTEKAKAELFGCRGGLCPGQWTRHNDRKRWVRPPIPRGEK
jgi:hypothetical protein